MSESDQVPLWKTLLQACILVTAAVLSDPEMRKNAIWAVRWNAARLQAWLNPPQREPAAHEIAGVIAEAEAARAGSSET